MHDFSGFSELFDLVELEVITQKRILAIVSGAILPIVALSFVHVLTDYLKELNNEVQSDSITEEKFGGEWVVLVRLHSRILQLKDKFISKFGADKLVDVTDYDDVQELIAVADVMISDYSSAIFDFLLTKKPGFIYATDIEEYSNERGMYYSVYDTPFSVAKNNDELVSAIENYNEEEYLEKVKSFLEEKGCIEDGNASTRIIEFINSIAYNIKSDK